MQKNVTGQKWIVFAFNRTDSTPLTGDAANITANLRIDGGTANAVDDVNPTELEDGYYVFDITQTESNGEMIVIAPVSSTPDIQVIGVPGVVYTTPANFPDISIVASTGLVSLSATSVDDIWDEVLTKGTHNVNNSAGKLLRLIKELMLSVEGTVNDGSATTTEFITDLTNSDDTHYEDQTLTFIDGNNAGQSRVVISYNGTTKTLTFDEAFTNAPANGDAFNLAADHVHNVTQIASAIWDLATSGHVTAGTFGAQAKTVIDAIQTVVTAIKLITDALPDSGALTSLSTAANLALIDTVVDAIKIVTDEIAALKVKGTVDTGAFSPTTTEFEADDITEATADHYNGRVVVWKTGVLTGQASDITNYALSGSNGHFTVTAMTEAPGNNDTFEIV